MPRFEPPPTAAGHDWPATVERLQRVARAVCGCEHAAEDLTQQALAAALSRAPDKADHFGYLRTTLVRLWIDRQRSWLRRTRLALRYASKFVCGESATRDAERGEELHAVRTAIAALPPQQRAVFVLRVMEELPYEEIAETLACSVASVRSNLHLARRRVRATVGE